MATVARKNFLLTGRNLGQIQTQRWAGSDGTGWVEREIGRGQEGEGKEIDRKGGESKAKG